MTPVSVRASALVLAAGLSAGVTACGADLVLPPNPVRLTVEGSGRGSGTVTTTVGPPPTLTCRILEGSAAVFAVMDATNRWTEARRPT